ncbi:MAG: PadR family transcriptional regulator [Candidatus Hydrothermarchaeales archaeon]
MNTGCCPDIDICPPECCDMRGMLSFLILWLLSKKPMYGEEIARELERMRGEKPTPGTIYPALKQLEKNGNVASHKEGKKVIYSLTEDGEKGVKEAVNYFCKAFGEIFEDYMKQI